MTHLTILGLWGGAPICGVSRVAAVERGEGFLHPNARLLEQAFHRKNICPDCLAAWDNPEHYINPVQGSSLHGAA